MLILLQAAAGWSMAENIIVTAITSGFIIAVAKLVRDWSADKTEKKHENKLKEETAESSEIANEERKISLGDKYIESSKQIIELLKTAQTSQSGNFERVNEKLDTMAQDIIGIKREQSDMREFLNGDYGEFLRQKYNLK